MRLIERFKKWRSEAAERSVKRAIRLAIKETKELQKRPFSDQYDNSAGGGGYGGSASAQFAYKRGEDELAKALKAKPPIAAHPRSRSTSKPGKYKNLQIKSPASKRPNELSGALPIIPILHKKSDS